MIISNFCRTGPRMATRVGMIEAVAGTDQILRRSGLILLAALWHEDLAPQFAGRVKARMFTDDLLRAVAAFSVGNLSTFGVNELATVERMLRERFAGGAVTITIQTIRTLVELIEVDDVEDALDLQIAMRMANPSRGRALAHGLKGSAA